MTEKRKLNLGCGRDIRKGYVNLDMRKEPGVDVVHDFSDCKLPFSSNYFDEVYASHVIEHIYEFKAIMKEIHRVLKKGGILHVRVPHFMYSGAFHPHHRIFFNFNSFTYLCKRYRGKEIPWTNIEYEQIFSNIKKLRINFMKGFHLENYIPEILVNISNFTRSVYEDTFLRNIFIAREVEAIIEK